MAALTALFHDSGVPASMKYPSNGIPPKALRSAKTGKSSLSRLDLPSGISSKTSSSRIYEPALMRLLNTSSGAGFSLNLVTSRFSSIPTIPNLVGSATSQRAKVPKHFMFSCCLSMEEKSRDDTTSPLKQAKVPLR